MGFYVPTNNDVKFPKACEHCHFYDGLLCCVLDTYLHDPENKQEDCPLIPVPEHGRLIDADALMLKIQDYIEEYGWETDENGWHNEKWCAMKETEMAINDAPTIIPADKDEA